LVFDLGTATAQITVPGIDTLPNLPAHSLPQEIAAFNNQMARLGVTNLGFSANAEAESFASLIRGRPMDLGLTAAITIMGA
jgi:hypothetical protein